MLLLHTFSLHEYRVSKTVNVKDKGFNVFNKRNVQKLYFNIFSPVVNPLVLGGGATFILVRT